MHQTARTDLYNLVLCHALIEWLGGTVWRSQAVDSCNLHGLPAAPVDRATHRSTADRAIVECGFLEGEKIGREWGFTPVLELEKRLREWT